MRRFMNAALKVGKTKLEEVVTSVQRGVTEISELQNRLELSDSKLLSALHQLESLDVLEIGDTGETLLPGMAQFGGDTFSSAALLRDRSFFSLAPSPKLWSHSKRWSVSGLSGGTLRSNHAPLA